LKYKSLLIVAIALLIAENNGYASHLVKISDSKAVSNNKKQTWAKNPGNVILYSLVLGAIWRKPTPRNVPEENFYIFI